MPAKRTTTRRKTTTPKRKAPARKPAKYVVTVKATMRSSPVSKTKAEEIKRAAKRKAPGATVTMRKV